MDFYNFQFVLRMKGLINNGYFRIFVWKNILITDTPAEKHKLKTLQWTVFVSEEPKVMPAESEYTPDAWLKRKSHIPHYFPTK